MDPGAGRAHPARALSSGCEARSTLSSRFHGLGRLDRAGATGLTVGCPCSLPGLAARAVSWLRQAPSARWCDKATICLPCEVSVLGLRAEECVCIRKDDKPCADLSTDCGIRRGPAAAGRSSHWRDKKMALKRHPDPSSKLSRCEGDPGSFEAGCTLLSEVRAHPRVDSWPGRSSDR